MRLSKFLATVSLVAIISLLIVHQEIELVKASYKIQSNSNKLNDLLDRNKILEYNVIALKTPTNLESRLKSCDVKLVWPEREQVMKLADVKIKKENNNTFEKRLPQVASFFSLFTLRREAQAEPR